MSDRPTPPDPSADDDRLIDADDPGYARLRAADPAGTETELSAVRAAIEERIRPSVPDSGPVRWWRIVAAAAAVLLVGGAGFAVGTATRPAGTSAAPGAGSGQGTNEGSALDLPVPANTNPAVLTAPPGAQSSSGGSSADSASAWGYGRLTFTGKGLSTAGGTAPVWSYDAREIFSAAGVQRIATGFGVQGTPTQQYGSWVVGPTDGSGPTVWLNSDGAGSFNYSNPGADPSYSCGAPATIDKSGREPMACAPTSSSVPPIDSATATARAKELLTALGQDPAAFTFDSQSYQEKGPYTYVTATPSTVKSGLSWSFGFIGDKLSYASGQLAPIAKVGDYKVVSPADAVARLNDVRFGASGGYGPVVATDSATARVAPDAPLSAPGPTSVPTAAPAPFTGGSVPWPVSQVTITGATLGSMLAGAPNGASLVVPAYTLTDGSGASWIVIAVADEQLNFSAR